MYNDDVPDWIFTPDRCPVCGSDFNIEYNFDRYASRGNEWSVEFKCCSCNLFVLYDGTEADFGYGAVRFDNYSYLMTDCPVCEGIARWAGEPLIMMCSKCHATFETPSILQQGVNNET